MEFNRAGYLLSATAVEATLEDIKAYFVTAIAGSSTRADLFATLSLFLQDIKTLSPNHLIECWIDGSFTSLKINPKDIDIVTFTDYRSFGEQLETMKSYTERYRLSKLPLDLYLVRRYPEEHPYFIRFQSDRAYWLHLFSSTRKDKRGRSEAKGFVKLTW